MDLRFQTFGDWLVLGKAAGNDQEPAWICQCACNTTAAIDEQALLDGRARGCGCQRGNGFKDLTGQRFGNWLVLSFARRRIHATYWLCRCRCGTLREVSGTHLRRRKTTSCGCMLTTLTLHRWYGRLFTIKRLSRKRWLTRCTCGKAHEVSGYALADGKVQSCGCHPPGITVNAWYGELFVLTQAPTRRGRICWHCQCVCGTERTVSGTYLRTAAVPSCGCKDKSLVKDLQGQIFGRLRVLERVGTTPGRSALWLCQCTCGTACHASRHELHSGQKRSCGCWRRETAGSGLRQWQAEERLRKADLPTSPCAACGTHLPHTPEFFPRNGYRQGTPVLSPYCKPCARRKNAEKARRRAQRAPGMESCFA